LQNYGGTFSNIGEQEPIANIRAALRELNSSGSDIIVSVGDGSPIDASKAIIHHHQQERGGEFLKHYNSYNP
jgi:alcohol dehydrogenase class IV